MEVSLRQSFELLRVYCEKEDFKGWDPFDGLSSNLFKSLPFVKNNRFFRLIWIQFFKKSPLNLRLITNVPKEYNAKGLGLFLTGYCNLYHVQPSEEY
ncbi:MAG: hypothetical protein ACM3H8_16795, partial [Sphingobacteriales bacterium]